ncbi:MAG TPA: SEC-C metal-binding domain-containing protein, partial [Phycisphaerae bacterium]|nr:SEC-C metal-binding domain-containing protein [Phycisphaerae bacterium]
EDPKQWDLRGLSSWAMSRFNVNFSQNQLRGMTPAQVASDLAEAAIERVDQLDLSPLGAYIERGFAGRALAEWARSKFGIDVGPDELGDEPAEAEEVLLRKAEQVYRQREIEYPVEYALEVTVGHGGTDNVYALTALCEWANRKYDAALTPEQLQNAKAPEIRRQLMDMSEAWLAGGKLEETVRHRLGINPQVESAIEFARERFDTELAPEHFDGDVAAALIQAGRGFLRREMSELERFVLLQTYDSAWVDHLLAMDHLKSSIGLRGYAEQDPRVAYKREGAKQFQEMLAGVRDKVSDLIFKVRLTSETEMTNVYQVTSAIHEQLSGYDHLAQEMAAQQAAGAPRKVEQIIRDAARVGRNDPCPCGSGKKFKKCCGKGA